MVTRHDNGSFSTTMFAKTTHTYSYLDFSSHHPLATTDHASVVRADRICTFQWARDAEKEQVSKALKCNGYPKSVIHQHWRTSPTSAPPPSPDMPKATITLPYVCHLAKSIRRILAPLDVQVCFHPQRTLKTIPGAAQRPQPSGEESRSSLSNSLWDTRQSIHWTDRPDTQPTAKRTQKSPDIRKPSASSYSRTCHGRDVRDRLKGGTGHG